MRLRQSLREQSFEGELYRNLHTLIEDNYDVIKAAKPDVSKNSAGYYLWNVWDRQTGVFDITKIIVGSQGTLGMLTEAKLRLVPLKKHSRLCVVFLKDLGPVGRLVEAVLPFHPESIESYDDKTMQVRGQAVASGDRLHEGEYYHAWLPIFAGGVDGAPRRHAKDDHACGIDG